MIAPRDTTTYTPKKFKYGSETTRVVEKTPRGRTSPPRKVSEKNWRDSNDYRSQYFERNKGIGGFGYICSQCWKPMFWKSATHVDHIIPPSRFAKKKKVNGEIVKTSFRARLLNNSFNCAAICQSCNSKKSNSMDLRILQGYAMKSLELTYAVGQFILAVPIMITAFGMWGIRKLVVNAFGLGGGRKRKSSKRRTRNRRR